MRERALGLIEVIGFVAAIEGADAALKAANVSLNGIDKVGGGIVTAKLFGDVGAIKAAIDAGGSAAEKVGTLRATNIIPRLHEDVEKMLFGNKNFNVDKEIQRVSVSDEKEKEQDKEEKEENDKVDFSSNELDQKEKLSELKTKSNSELKKLVQFYGIEISKGKLNSMKKADLINLLTEFYEEEKE